MQDISSSRSPALAVLTFGVALAFAVTPFIADPFRGFEPDQFPVPIGALPIQPAGWAFSIWGAIYLWLIIGTGYGALKQATDPGWAPHRPWLIASLAIGTAWLFVANESAEAATILIVAMLLTALKALALAPPEKRSLVRWPIGLYAGWLTAASFVAIATLAAGYGLAAPQLASWIALPPAVILAAWLTLRLWTPTYPAAAAWAAIGISVANYPSGFAWGAATGATLLIALTSLAIVRRL